MRKAVSPGPPRAATVPAPSACASIRPIGGDGSSGDEAERAGSVIAESLAYRRARCDNLRTDADEPFI